jgi:hypothetical protein
MATARRRAGPIEAALRRDLREPGEVRKTLAALATHAARLLDAEDAVPGYAQAALVGQLRGVLVALAALTDDPAAEGALERAITKALFERQVQQRIQELLDDEDDDYGPS